MSSSASPDIVTNGLVLCLDAADKRSYPGTGTTWFDRSGGGSNGTLVNGVGYNSGNGGSLVFNGVNNRGVEITGTNLSLNQMTISSWNYSTNYEQTGFMFEKDGVFTEIGIAPTDGAELKKGKYTFSNASFVDNGIAVLLMS